MANKATGENRIWTPANIVTLVRICLVPVFVVAILSPWPDFFPLWPEADEFKPLVAAFIFLALSLTDSLDGYLARSRNEVTNFGKFVDPLADKILVAAALLALIELQVLPSWVALVILCREFIVSGIRMLAASKGVVIAASWYGKAKTVAQIVAILLFILKDWLIGHAPYELADPLYLVAWLVMIIALVLTVVSMVDYFQKSRELLGFGTSRKKTPAQLLVEEEGKNIEREDIERLSHDVLEKARDRSCMIATAESLTGGLIASALTSVPGSSDVIAGGIVSYANEAKTELLEVCASDIAQVGAVSEEVAASMARGACKALSCDLAVSVTGIAGPGGAVPGKPVGTVWLATSYKGIVETHRFVFKGDRDAVRLQTVDQALRALYVRLDKNR